MSDNEMAVVLVAAVTMTAAGTGGCDVRQFPVGRHNNGFSASDSGKADVTLEDS